MHPRESASGTPTRRLPLAMVSPQPRVHVDWPDRAGSTTRKWLGSPSHWRRCQQSLSQLWHLPKKAS